MILNQGTLLNNLYRVINLLGKGSMGNVYLVERIKDNKKIVVKELSFTEGLGLDPAIARELFFREAEFIARFDHPGLPKMYGNFSHEGRDYLVMDYIEGKNLEELIDKVDEKKAIGWIIELTEILDYLHNSFQSPVVYRDLKPSNIIITPSDNVKLVDFGIARYYNPDKNTDTFSYGSPGYAAPEQYKGRGQTTPLTDIFGLGVILYQMLTKQDPTVKPFAFPSLDTLNPEVEKIVRRAVSLEPLKRYISMKEFKEALERYIKIDVKKHYSSDNISYKPNKFAKAGLCLAIVTAVLPFFLYFFSRTILPPDLSYFLTVKLAFLFPGIVLLVHISGLITSIKGKRNYEKDINIACKPSGDAMGCNLLLIIPVLVFVFFISNGFRKDVIVGRYAFCESNLKRLAIALETYAKDNEGHYPSSLEILTKPGKNGKTCMEKLPLCLSSGCSYGYTYSIKPDNFTLWCGKPQSHSDISSRAKEGSFPQYNPGQGLIMMWNY